MNDDQKKYSINLYQDGLWIIALLSIIVIALILPPTRFLILLALPLGSGIDDLACLAFLALFGFSFVYWWSDLPITLSNFLEKPDKGDVNE